MDGFITYLVIALISLAVVGVGGYFLLRRLFLRGADRMAHQIERVLDELATAALDPRLAAASAAAARAASRRATRMGAYATSEGMSEDAARAEFARSIERIARIMDSAVKLPVVGGVGLDALLGLVPVAGDAASAAVSVSLIARSLRYGVPREIVTKMLANVLLDLLLGAVPIVGDLADMWFKANLRNVALLKEYLGDEARDVIDVRVASRG